jgi:hypothetical protein
VAGGVDEGVEWDGEGDRRIFSVPCLSSSVKSASRYEDVTRVLNEDRFNKFHNRTWSTLNSSKQVMLGFLSLILYCNLTISRISLNLSVSRLHRSCPRHS